MGIMNFQLFVITALCVAFTLGQQHSHHCRKDVSLPQSLFDVFCLTMYSSDKDGNLELTPQEFMSSVYRSLPKKTIQAHFLTLDVNLDGVISAQDDDEHFHMMDTNGDEKIDINEYIKFWTTQQCLVTLTVLFERTKAKHGVDTLDKNQLKDFFETIPGKDDGSWTKSEIERAYNTPAFATYPHAAGVNVALFDSNKDDVITTAEVTSLLVHLDKNGDGKLQYAELRDAAVKL